LRLKLYLNDWFINMGMVGFIRILEEAGKKEQLLIKDNSIEFESSLLHEFNEDYFSYFLKRYDICKRETSKTYIYLDIAKKGEKFKDAVKWIKQVVDINRKKISGKLDNKTYEERFEEIFKEAGNIKSVEQIEQLQLIVEKFKELMGEEEVNNKLTINYVRSIFSSQYFGQASFLQRTCASKTLDEQSEIMFRDYVKPILEEVRFDEIIYCSKDLEELKSRIDNELKQEELSKEYTKLLKDIAKTAKKNSFEEIKNSFYKETLRCSIWEDYRASCDFTEGVFVPLAVSTNNAKNFMWDFNTSYPISNLVKLILLCTPAGTVDMHDDYFGFVNMDIDVDDLWKYNENFRARKDEETPFESLVYDIVAETSKKSRWALSNILFIEFKASYEAKSCKLNYFNIPKATAYYFSEYAAEDIGKLRDRQFKKNLVSLILNIKATKTVVYKGNYDDKDIHIANDINSLIDIKLRSDIKKNIYFAYDVFMATIANYRLKRIKEGCEKVDNKKIWVVFKSGQELNSYFKNKGSENKIAGIAYRLLNASKSGNKNAFMDSVLRIYMTSGKEIPSIFLNVLHEKDLDFETVAHAFVAGLISNEKSEEVKGDK
jgi:CRISPR-associated protein Cst1